MKPLDPNRNVPSLFDSIANRFPNRPAAIFQSGSINYAELQTRANRLANRILQRGDIGDRIAFLLPYDISIIVTTIAALKAGRMVVALDPNDPAERLKDILADCSPTTIIADQHYRSLAKSVAGDSLDIVDPEEPSIKACAETNPELPLGPDSDGFLIYTSGSTGKPKGVVRSHGLSIHRPLEIARRMDLNESDRFVVLRSIWGGQGLNSLFIPLLHGAAFLPFPATQVGVTGLADWLREQQATILSCASSLLRHFMKTLDATSTFPDIRIVRVAADVTNGEDLPTFRKHFPNADLLIVMGASEAGSIACHRLSREDPVGTGALPVGRPLDGITVRVLDENGEECPPGITGRLTIQSRFLASRYWQNPELSARSFTDCDDGTRIFWSNDLASIDSDGLIRLAGRSDDTYKVRGNRVDLGDVDAALMGLPGVKDAAAIVAPRANGEPQLIGLYTANQIAPPSPARLRTIARARLLNSLVPSVFLPVDHIPRTPNGKVNRRQLASLIPSQRAESDKPARTETEKLLVRIWEEAFDQAPLGREDDFFALGGDSLIFAVISARVHGETGIQVTFRDIVSDPRLSELASAIDRKRQAPGGEDAFPLVQTERDGPLPLSPTQEMFWKDTRTLAHALRGNRAASVELVGPLDVATFRKSLSTIVARFETLNTRFALEDDQPVQIIEPAQPVDLTFCDLSGERDPDGRAAKLISEEAGRPFDLTEAPPRRFFLLRLSDERHLFIRSAHHILYDGPSWLIFFEDLALAYEAYSEGREPDLGPPGLQYADFAVWQHHIWRRDGPAFQRAIAEWKTRLQDGQFLTQHRWFPQYVRRKPADAAETVREIGWGLDTETALRLDQVGQEEAATFYVTRLALLSPVAAALLNEDAVMIGGIFTQRGRKELERTFGPLLNLIPLLLKLDWNTSFKDFVRQVRRLVIDSQDLAGLPFELLASELASQGLHMPAPILVFRLPTERPTINIGKAEIRNGPRTTYQSKGLFVAVNPVREDDGCAITFDRRIYSAGAMLDLADRFRRFAYTAARSPEMSLGDLIETNGIRDVQGPFHEPQTQQSLSDVY